MQNQPSIRKYHFIYKTTRVDGSGAFYIGLHSTDDLDDGYLGSGIILNNSIKKYGKHLHIREILEFLPSRDELCIREAELVSNELVADPRCMNITLGGGGARPGIENHFFGRKHSTESKEKIARSKIGKSLSPETKAKLSVANKGKPGKKHTREAKTKLKNAWVERRKVGVSSKTKEKMSKSHLGSKYIFSVVSPTGLTTETRDLKTFCESKNISYSIFMSCMRAGKKPTGRNTGWEITRIEIKDSPQETIRDNARQHT
jgi:hypothetical protein